MRTPSWFAAVALSMVLLSLPVWPVAAQRARSTERITASVEILERDDTPVMPCGFLGSQPRDVTARVLAVEEGTLAGERVLLRWHVCSLGIIAVGLRYRIELRAFTDAPRTPETRYRVRRFTPLTP